MGNVYIQALIESLEKKIEVLEEIHLKDEEQYKLTCEIPIRMDEFDRNFEEKSVLITRLNKLDDGFETVYAKVKEELGSNKAQYTEEISRMQELITRITDLSTQIQAEEARNKAAMETAFKREKDKIKQARSGIKAVNSYVQAMRGFPIN